MLRSIVVFVIAAMLAGGLCVQGRAATAAGDAGAALAAGQRFALPGTVVIKLRENRPIAKGSVRTGIARLDARLIGEAVDSIKPVLRAPLPAAKPGGPDLSRVYVVRYGSGRSPEALARELAADPAVEYAEPHWCYPLAAVPNDPFYTSQRTYLERMQFPAAWDLLKGESGSVVVAIVDGGTDWDLADLVGNIWTNPGETPGNGIDDDGNGFVDDVRGWNFANDTNDPTGLPSTPGSGIHGTHTAGIACAMTNNSSGVAGATWNAKVMPVNTAVAGFDGAIGFGYEGILYAARAGADVINCSWGGLGSPSQFEREVVEMARDLGAAVVAAAGNQSTSAAHFPSSYPSVLSVANVDNNDIKNSSSNFGLDVDVSAQGTFIRSLPLNNFGQPTLLSGTSMSSPHAAAVAALVKTKWPTYTADQVLQRVRVTADNIDSKNLPFAGQLGFGRVNALRALTVDTPAIRVTGLTFTETDGDGIIEPGEQVEVVVTVTNYLSAATNIDFTLTENSTRAGIPQGQAHLDAIGELESATLSPFLVNISVNAPVQTTIPLRLEMTAASPAYTDADGFEITVLPVFVTHNINNVQTSVTSKGRIGFALALGGNGTDGVGFSYKGSSNLLFEGALMIGTGVGQISDAARGPSPDRLSDDFTTSEGGVPTLETPGGLADQQSTARFDDSIAPLPLQVDLLQQVFQYADAPNDDYVILAYTITNTSTSPLGGVRIGWFCDWDIDGASFGTNRTGFDAMRNLGYTYDNNGGAGGVYAGTSVLTPPGATSYRAIFNDQDDPRNPSWGIYDNFTDTEKWDALSGGTTLTEVGPTDVSSVLSTGPFDIAAGQSIQVAFAFLAGDDLADLQANADAALAKWLEIETSTPVEIADLRAEAIDGDVWVRWSTRRERDVQAFRVFRSRDGGPLESLQPEVTPDPGRQYAFRDPRPEPGAYTYRVGEVGTDGSLTLHGAARVHVTGAPRRTFLAPNVPNPFNPTTTITFGLATAGPARIVIYDGRGRHVRTLFDASRARAGAHEVVWDGTNREGRAMASGVYLVRLEQPGRVLSRRMTLVK